MPCDFRLYEKDGKTRNEHFREMALAASDREFDPEYVVFDNWQGGLDNLKKIRDLGWAFFTRLKKNRKMGPDDTYNRQVQEIDIPKEGRVVHLKGFGFVRVPQAVSTNRDTEDEKTEENEEKKVQYWATNDLEMTEEKRETLARRAWGVETHHRRPGAVLWSRTVSMPKRRGATQPHSDVDPSLPAVGTTPSGDGDQLLRIEDRNHPGGDSGVFGRSNPRSALKCVSPIGIRMRHLHTDCIPKIRAFFLTYNE